MSDLPDLPPLPEPTDLYGLGAEGYTPEQMRTYARTVQEAERAIVSDELERFRNGYQGSCYACEPVGVLNQKLEAQIAELRNVAQQWQAARSPVQPTERVLMQRRLQSPTDLCENEWYPWEEVFGPDMTIRQTDVYEYAWFERHAHPRVCAEADPRVLRKEREMNGKLSYLWKRALMEGRINDPDLQPSALVIARGPKDEIRVYIANSKGDELCNVVEDVELSKNGTLTLTNFDRAFNITLAV